MVQTKTVVVLAGPNGAGKTTNARILLPEWLGDAPFVNADIIEREISEPGESSRAFAAGRLMLTQIRELAARGENLAFETTLASRTFAPLLRELAADGYQVNLAYFWLKNADMAIRRVAERVSLGGHHVPEDVVRRRYHRGLRNFFTLYQPIAHTWRVYDNSGRAPALVAHRLGGTEEIIAIPETWQAMQREAERT